jgi:hypothetical protein
VIDQHIEESVANQGMDLGRRRPDALGRLLHGALQIAAFLADIGGIDIEIEIDLGRFGDTPFREPVEQDRGAVGIHHPALDRAETHVLPGEFEIIEDLVGPFGDFLDDVLGLHFERQRDHAGQFDGIDGRALRQPDGIPFLELGALRHKLLRRGASLGRGDHRHRPVALGDGDGPGPRIDRLEQSERAEQLRLEIDLFDDLFLEFDHTPGILAENIGNECHWCLLSGR